MRLRALLDTDALGLKLLGGEDELDRGVRGVMTTDLRPELGQITVPVTVVYAWDASYGFPGAAMDQVISHVYAGLPQVRFERIDDSLHFIMPDQPQRLAASLSAFPGGWCRLPGTLANGGR